MKNKKPMSIRIVEGEYSQTLMRVISFEVMNTEIKATHETGITNVAQFGLPASIFVMINNQTIDHIKK